MPYVIRYRPGDRLAVIEFTGHVTGGEVGEAIETLIDRLPADPAPLSVLCDTRTATSVFAVSGDIERTVRALNRLEKHAPSGRGAYLGGRNHALFVSLVRVVLKLAGRGRRERRVYTDYEEALAWLTEEA